MMESLDEKRAFPRYLIQVNLHMKGLNSRGENIDTDLLVVDISVEGIGFLSNQIFRDGEILYVELRGKDHTSDVNMQILWADNTHHRFGARILSSSQSVPLS